MTARVAIALLFALAPVVHAQTAAAPRAEDCVRMLQPTAAPGEDGYLHAYAPLPAACASVLKVTGWHVSNDGRTFEPHDQTTTIKEASVEDDHLKAQVGAGLYMFRPVLATLDDRETFTGASVPVSISDAVASQLAKLRVPGATVVATAAPADKNAKGTKGVSVGGTKSSTGGVNIPGGATSGIAGAPPNGATGLANDGSVWLDNDLNPAPGASRLADANNSNPRYTGPYTSGGTGGGMSGGVGGGVGGSSSNGGYNESNNSNGGTTPTPAPTVQPPVPPPLVTSGSNVFAGGKVVASQGTVTGAVRLAWNLNPAGYTYNVYRWQTVAAPFGFAKVAENVSGNSYDDVQADVAIRKYMLRSVGGDGKESADSIVVTGYANAAPTAAEATINAVKNKTSARFNATVADANLAAGQTEGFTITIKSQPPVGEGTAVAAANGLQWVPPSDFHFIGDTSFEFQVTDKAGEVVVGVAKVIVAFPTPAAPTGFKASMGTVTDAIEFKWQALVGFAEYIATGYNIYNVDTSPPTKINPTPILDTAYVYATPSHAAASYTLRAITTVGESLPTTPLRAWSNAALRGASAPNMVATAITQSAPTPITFDDENLLLGEDEAFLVSIATQPSVGTATVSGDGKLVWTPPKNQLFQGVTTFTFLAADKGKAKVTGLATVTVAPPAGGGGDPRIESTRRGITSAKPTVAANVALECAKKFLLMGDSNTLSTSVPVTVSLTFMKNEEANCGGVTPLETVFLVSPDKRNYVPLETASAYVGNVSYVRNSISDRAALVITKPGTYYFHVVSRVGTSNSSGGTYKVTTR